MALMIGGNDNPAANSPAERATTEPFVRALAAKDVNHVTVYADGELALSTSNDRTIKVWDLTKGEIVKTLRGHVDNVRHVVVYDDGRRAISASRDNTLKIWDLSNGKSLHTLRGHRHWVRHVTVFANGQRALSASRDRTLKVWDLTKGKLIHTLEGHSDLIRNSVVFPDGQRALSASRDRTLKVWDLTKGKLIHTFDSHTAPVRHVVVYAEGQRALSTSDDGTLKIWDLTEYKMLRSLVGHTGPVRHAVIYAGGQRALSVSDDGTLKVWDIGKYKLIRTLEGHSGEVRRAVVYADGRRTLSASSDGTLKLWDLNKGKLIRTLEGHTKSIKRVVVYNDGKQALSASDDGTLRIWDLIAVEKSPPTENSGLYVNAKVVIVGDSGVGKSGLRLVLQGEPFTATPSTHGRFVTRFHAEKFANTFDSIVHREILMWDLGGQPGYRLLHQLHLHDVAIALIVFDAKSETDPYAGIFHWDRALRLSRKIQGNALPPIRKFLVAARTDRTGPAISRERANALCNKLGFENFFSTSAAEGVGIAELRDAICAGINWDDFPPVVSTYLFQEIKHFIVEKKNSGLLLAKESTLFRSFRSAWTAGIQRQEFRKCVDLLRDTGLIRRLVFGDLVLLQPEILDNYASALINAAKDKPDGFGCIFEDDALQGRFKIPKECKLRSSKQEKLLLIAMVKDLLAHEIALRESCDGGMLLIFPSQFTRENPDLPDPPGKAAVLEFEGPVLNIYTRLAVRLALSGTFVHQELWKNAVTYKPRSGTGKCGVFVSEVEEGKGRLTLFYADETPTTIRDLFEVFITDHLEKHALLETIKIRRIIVCHQCATRIDEGVVNRRLERGLKHIICPDCETQIPLKHESGVVTDRTAENLRSMSLTADSNRDLAVATAIIGGKRATQDFDVFLSYQSVNRSEVRVICEELEMHGILPWLDEREIAPGERWQDALQEQITTIKAVAILLGEGKLGRWQKLEIDGFIKQFVDRGSPVIPVILPSCISNPEMPSFLSDFQTVDFRKSSPAPITQLIWGITGKRSAHRPAL